MENLGENQVHHAITILDEQSEYYQSICKGEIKDDLSKIRLYILCKSLNWHKSPVQMVFFLHNYKCFLCILPWSSSIGYEFLDGKIK